MAAGELLSDRGITDGRREVLPSAASGYTYTLAELGIQEPADPKNPDYIWKATAALKGKQLIRRHNFHFDSPVTATYDHQRKLVFIYVDDQPNDIDID